MKRYAFPVVLLAVITAQALFVAAYISHEHTVYFWDHAMYRDMAESLWLTLRNGFFDAWKLFRLSMANPYNDIFALPSLLSFSIFSPSRLVFILTNFFVFFLAYEFAVAFVVSENFPISWPAAVYFALALCSFIPPLWHPLLEGYPDIGAAACFTMAIGLAFQPLSKLRYAALTGFLLAFSFLLRRHFAYPVVAFLLTKSMFDFYYAVWHGRTGSLLIPAIKYISYYALCGLVLIGTIFVIAPDLISTIMSTDYSALYSSYKRTPITFITFTLNRFGLTLLGLATCGLVLTWRMEPETRKPLLLIMAIAAVEMLIWIIGPSQTGHHYLLHILPLLIVVGITGLFVTINRFPKKLFARIVSVVIAVSVTINGAWAIWFAHEGIQPNSFSSPKFLSAPRPPVVREDVAELAALAAHLAKTTGPDDYIYVVGSSFVFNQDLLRAVFSDILGNVAFAQHIVFGAEVDSRETPPLNSFASASVYVVAEPTQYHLDPDQQKDVTAIATLFPPPPARKNLYQEDPRSFMLSNDVKVKIWRRKYWSPEALHEELAEIREKAAPVQADWVSLTPLRYLWIETTNSHKTNVDVNLSSGLFDSIILFLDRPVSPDAYTLDMNVLGSPSCAGVSFVLTALKSNGQVLGQKAFSAVNLPGFVVSSFALTAGDRGPFYLKLQMKPKYNYLCSVSLQNITLRQRQEEHGSQNK